MQVEILSGVPLAESVSVDPVAADDWERTELNAERLEECLLQQVAPHAQPAVACMLPALHRRVASLLSPWSICFPQPAAAWRLPISLS